MVLVDARRETGLFLLPMSYPQVAVHVWPLRPAAAWRRAMILVIAGIVLAGASGVAEAYTRAEKQAFQRSIVDRRSKLNPRFKKKTRAKTRGVKR